MLKDKLLVLKCRRGSKDAMYRIYEKYKDDLVTLAAALLNDISSTEDIVHDVFVIFAQSAEKIQPENQCVFQLLKCEKGNSVTKMIPPY